MSAQPVAITGHAYGVGIRILAAPECRLAVLSALPQRWIPGPAGPTTPTFVIKDRSHIPIAMSGVELHIAENARGLIFIHAGAVAIDGKGILIPGRSMSGKSTLVAALVSAGASYYSDEYAVLAKGALMLPYPRPIHLRGGAGEPITLLEPAKIGTIGTAPVPVAVIAHLAYRTKPTRSTWDVAELSPARRVLALIDNAVAARSRTAEVLSRCSAVAESARLGLTGTRGDAYAAADAILDLVRQPSTALP